MLASNNVLSPAHGAPITIPTQDMVLGCYYLTKSRPGTKGEGRTFASTDDVLIALEMGEVETLTPIKLRYTGRVIDLVHAFDTQNVIHTEPIEFNKQYMETTVGRVILNDHLPEEMPYINAAFSRKRTRTARSVLLSAPRIAHHGPDARRSEVARVPVRDPRGALLIGIDDMVPSRASGARANRGKGSGRGRKPEYQRMARSRTANAITRSSKSGPRSPSAFPDEMFQAMEEDDRTGRRESDLHHGRLRRARFEAADPAACRHAWFDGETIG